MEFPVISLGGLEFRRGDAGGIKPIEFDLARIDESLAGIRCPLCKWRPRRSSRWTCWDCGHPEYFYDACGTEWNTFLTRGLCPTCLHQWAWTSCLACSQWSRHEDWYVEDEKDSA